MCSLGDVINSFRTNTLKLDSISPLWGYRLIPRLRVPYTYLWSQSLIPKPPDWDDHIRITGFSFLPLANSYTPPPDLASFLEKGPPPIYIGFGSIVVADPQALTDMILEAVKIAGVRAIVSKGWGGVGSGDVPENIYLIGNCPHDWLFQRVSAVVHHGGAGTTAAGIALGRPTVVVPFFGDQPFWGQMIAQAGAGPVPISFKKLTAATLADSILFALKPEVQKAVQNMAQEISEEDGAGDTSRDFQERIDIDSFRCDLFPNRLAIWRHKKTGAHLSGLAATCLVQRRLIQRESMKLMRRKHWYVDEGTEHPIVGVIASATGFVRGIASATSSFRQRLKQPPAMKKSSRIAMVEKSPGMETDPVRVSPLQIQDLARRMATKSLGKNLPPVTISEMVDSFAEANDQDILTPIRTHVLTGKQHSQFHQVMRAIGIYAADLTKTSCKAPIAFFYNVASGCHNLPAYAFWSTEVRRRDEISGFGSGISTAGKEFVLGFYDAFSGLVILPYKGARQEGGAGFGKGCVRAFRGLILNILAGKSMTLDFSYVIWREHD
jgi:sterol 3beta-glucosyltransferase